MEFPDRHPVLESVHANEDRQRRQRLVEQGYEIVESPEYEDSLAHVLQREFNVESVEQVRRLSAVYLRAHVNDEDVVFHTRGNITTQIADIENGFDQDRTLAIIAACHVFHRRIIVHGHSREMRPELTGYTDELHIVCESFCRYHLARQPVPNDMEFLIDTTGTDETDTGVPGETAKQDADSGSVAENVQEEQGSEVEEVLDQSLDEDGQFQEDLVQKGFTIHNLPGGHSMYRILCQMAKKATEEELKEQLYEYAIDNTDEPEFREMRNAMTPCEYRNEENKLLDKDSISSTVGLMAACKKYNFNIKVHLPGGKVHIYRANKKTRSTLNVSLHHNSHFNLLLRNCNIVLDRKDAQPGEKTVPTPFEYEKHLETEGLYKISMPGDGDCLYTAILRYLKRKDVAKLRKEIAAYVKANLHENVMQAAFEAMSEEEIANEIKLIEDRRAWGGNATIVAATQIFNVNIHLYWYRTARHLFSAPGGPAQPTISLLYTDNHYDLLGRLDDPAQPKWMMIEVLKKIDTNKAQKIQTSNESNSNPKIKFTVPIPRSNQESDDDSYDDALSENDDSDTDDDYDDISDFAEDDPEMTPSQLDDYELDDEPDDRPVDDEYLNSIRLGAYYYISAKVFSSGRDQVDIFIVTPGTLSSETLPQRLTKNKNVEIKILVDYNIDKFRKPLLENSSIRRGATVWEHRIDIPWMQSKSDRSKWLTNLIIVPFILATMKMRWRTHKITVLMMSVHTAVPSKLLNKIWGSVSEEIKTDVKRIIANPDLFFCEKCSAATCPNFGKSWHLDIAKFKRAVFPQSEADNSFWQKFANLDRWGSVPRDVMGKLRDLYLNNDPEQRRIEPIFKVLDDNYAIKLETTWYGIYCVLLLEGPKMELYKDRDPQWIMNQDGVDKFVYTGIAENDRIRRGHFKYDHRMAGLNPLLTKHSQLYYIVSKRFKSWKNATTFEAMVIEIVKTFRRAYEGKTGVAPFYIVNHHSEVKKLASGKKKMRENIPLFTNTAIPVFRQDNAETPGYEGYPFTGNYIISEKVHMHPGTYLKREYKDVKDYHDQLKHITRR